MQKYNESKPLYDALENYTSGQLIMKMAAEGITTLAQATEYIAETAKADGELQSVAIASLKKIKAGLEKLKEKGDEQAVTKQEDILSSDADTINKDVLPDLDSIGLEDFAKRGDSGQIPLQYSGRKSCSGIRLI